MNPTAVDADRPVRTVTWDDFRRALRFGTTGGIVEAIPAMTAKRAEHPEVGEPVGPAAEFPGGRYAREFERGTIIWTADAGAVCLHGMVRDIWVLLGGRSGRLGLPLGDVATDEASGGAEAVFEGGRVAWSAPGGPVVTFA
ncbi:hypothetical protein ABIQ69_03460 [Agromyces sp. G08B096]|uniref:LGFP repeat-containing protein n=1 Tax=Agromyces sp. G08B096 TaxID=3156399 RepID=A0AAU7W8P7_9MICO